MSKAKKSFNEKGKKLLKEAIERLPGLSESLKEHEINLETVNDILVFGYGSLPDHPHYPPTSKTDAYLWDYKRDMCCRSITSGTYRAPGLTLGLDKKEGSVVPGAVLHYEDMSTYEKIEMLNKLADREVIKKLPIYKFELLKIKTKDGDTVLAITCIADRSAKSGYVGDMLTPMEKAHMTEEEQEDYSLRKKAAKIATANGEKIIYQDNDDGEIHKKFTTGKSYYDRFIKRPILENLIKKDPSKNKNLSGEEKKLQIALYKEQQRMLKLGKYIDEYREHMRTKAPKLVTHLEQIEQEMMEEWHENKAQLEEHLKHAAKQKEKIKKIEKQSSSKKPPAKTPRSTNSMIVKKSPKSGL